MTAIKRSLEYFLKRRWISIVIVVASFGLIVILWKVIPAEMAPLEDRSQISINTTAVRGLLTIYV